MGQSQIKDYKRLLRRTAINEKNSIITRYITDNWEQVVVSSVAIIRRFNFKNRFQMAMIILFKPDKQKPKPKTAPMPESKAVAE